MQQHRRQTMLLTAVVILSAQLTTCASVTRIPADQPLEPLPVPTATFGAAGPLAVSVESGERVGEYGCTLQYEVYRPSHIETTVMVILAHGFMRDLASMRGWAAHWSSYGVPVAVMSLCNARWFNGHHERNAADLVALARGIHDGPMLYAGFSAGGLAAYLAAAKDSRTLAYLGLDSVDSRGLGLSVAGQFGVPALFLLGEPSACNADNNFLETIAATRNCTALRVRYATHCAFEYPSDSRCERTCGSVRPQEASEIVKDTIRVLATAWVLTQALEYPLARETLESAESARGQWEGRIVVLR